MDQFAGSTHTGLIRDHNEDCFAVDGELGLWLVADGVGGHSFGEIASDIVRTTVTRRYREGASLVDAIRDAHGAVLEEIARRDDTLGMGSTVVACTVRDGEYTVAWVGDSRAYLWDGENLTQLSHDHTHVRDLVDQGLLTLEESGTHPERHVLTQSIGVFADMELDPGYCSGPFKTGQQMLLCSDGLTDELSDSKIAEQLRRHATPQAQADGLVNGALSAGGHDNVTVVIVGQPGTTGEAASAVDVETTQNIGQPVDNQARERTNNHDAKALLLLALLTAVAIYLWL